MDNYTITVLKYNTDMDKYPEGSPIWHLALDLDYIGIGYTTTISKLAKLLGMGRNDLEYTIDDLNQLQNDGFISYK